MLNIIVERLRQKFRTFPFPAREPVLPPNFRGVPVLHRTAPDLPGQAMEVCPTGALGCMAEIPHLDMGSCLFCGECERVAPKLVTFTDDYRLASLSRRELVVCADQTMPQKKTRLQKMRPPPKACASFSDALSASGQFPPGLQRL